MSAELKELEPRARGGRGAARAPCSPRRPTSRTRAAPTGSPTRTPWRCDGTSSPPSFDFAPRDHAELGELLGVLDIERGARTSGSRFVYLHGRPRVRAVRADASRDGHPGDEGVPAGDPAGDGARGGDVRHRVPAGRRGAALRDARGRPVPRGDRRGAARRAAPGRDPGRRTSSRRATSATRPASGARPAPTARTWAGCSVSTSSTRSRCSASRRPRRAGTSTSTS